MAQLIVVGSGASAVQFSIAALENDHDVTMIDVGHQPPHPVEPEYSLTELKQRLSDPVAYFLGDRYEGVLFPGSDEEYYGFPPSKQFIFAASGVPRPASTGFRPLFSYARGGLAEAWTGGVYPLNDQELCDFPIGYDDLAPYYGRIASQIGVSGTDDDLKRFYPLHDNLLPTLRLDEHSSRLLETYDRRKDRLNRDLNAYLGHSRLATLSRDLGERKACDYKGRCLWGCPSQSLYTPSITLNECLKHPRFRYQPNHLVSHFEFNGRSEIQCLVATSLADERPHRFEGDRFILAAGTLSSSKIVLESIYRRRGEIVKLRGLMDNRQILMPFLNPRLIGRQYDPNSYQYHQLTMGIDVGDAREFLHCQITTLTTALAHPLIQKFPFDLRSSIATFCNLRSGLGLVNINLHDQRRTSNYVTLQPDRHGGSTKLQVQYCPAPDDAVRVRRSIRSVRKALWRLGCLAPPGTMHIRPMGASVHYAGTMPMSSRPESLTTTRECRSHDFENLNLVDGSTFPFLPSKNITFTLMANAARVADNDF